MAIMAIEERPIKRRRLNDNPRFGLLEHLVAQLARTPPPRCGLLYRRLLLALQQERAEPRLAHQLSGLLLQSLEYVVTVRTEDDDDNADDFDDTIIRLAHDITLCLQQVFVFSEDAHGDEGGTALLTTLLRTLQLLEETSPEAILAIVPRFPVRLFSQLPDKVTQQWVVALVQHDARLILHSLSVPQNVDTTTNNKAHLYAKAALGALNSEPLSKDLGTGSDAMLMEFFFWKCMLVHDPSTAPTSISNLREGLSEPSAVRAIAIECLVLMSSTTPPDTKGELMGALVSVMAGTHNDDMLLLHRATFGLRNLLQEPEDYDGSLSIMTASNSTCDVLETLVAVCATRQGWDTRDTTVWGLEILWSLISYIAAGHEEDEAPSTPTAPVEVEEEKKDSDDHTEPEQADSSRTSPDQTAKLISIVIRALGQGESDEYSLYLGTRTVCNDHDEFFMKMARDHPELVTALAAVLEDDESSDVVRGSVLQFFTGLMDQEFIPSFSLARQEGVLRALAATDPSFLFLLSDSPENHAFLARSPGVIVAMVRHARQHQDDDNMGEYRKCRGRILELSSFL